MMNTKTHLYVYVALAVIFCSVLTTLSAGEAESGYGSECGISNVAPLIDEDSFFLSNTVVCTGESVEFAVNVSDDNGAADVSQVTVVLSDDENINEDDISIQLDRTGNVNAITATFGKVWTVKGETGLKNILITAEDSANLGAGNNGAKVGTLGLNPLIGFEVKDGAGGDLTTISFPESPPGALNVPLNKNPIQITNIGWTSIDVYLHGTSMTNGNETIPISNMRVDEIQMSTTPQLIADDIEAGATSSRNIFMDYPVAIPTGTYQGTVVFEITA